MARPCRQEASGPKGKVWGPSSQDGELTLRIGRESPRTKGQEGDYAALRIEGGRSPRQVVLDGSCKEFSS